MGAFTNGFYPYSVGTTISVEADSEDISAGQFVSASGTTDPSHNSQLTDGVLKATVSDAGNAADSDAVIGIAMEDISSGDVGSVALSGVFLVKSNGDITAGDDLAKAQTNDAYEVDQATDYNDLIGKALSSGSDNSCVLIHLNTV